MDKNILGTNIDLVNAINSTRAFKETKGAELVTVEDVLFYSNIVYPKRYEQFSVPKRNKTETRTINAPCVRLKFILRCINEILSSRYSPPFFVTGFVKGRSVFNNASVHYGQRCVYSLDLKDFFDNISCSDVVPKLTSMPLGISEEVATTITLLSSVFSVKKGKISLAQGSPISPILANFACADLDQALFNRSLRGGVRYSRYADDLTFSTSVFDFSSRDDFVLNVKCLIRENGFVVNDGKERIRKSSQRQEVTGLVVNTKPNVPREYFRELRDLLYIWEQYGLSAVINRYTKRRKLDYLSAISFIRILKGRIEYLGMIRGKSDAHYLRLHSAFFRLTEDALERGDFSFSSKPKSCYVRKIDWKFLEARNFSLKTLSDVVKHEIVSSKYGNLLRIWKEDGNSFCLPVDDNCKYGIGDSPSLSEAVIMVYLDGNGHERKRVAWQ